MVRLLALAVESGFALHTNRNFGPFYPPVVVDPISVLPGVNLEEALEYIDIRQSQLCLWLGDIDI